jgi:cell shape-determining protein MreC
MRRRTLNSRWVWIALLGASAALMGLSETQGIALQGRFLSAMSPILSWFRQVAGDLQPSRAFVPSFMKENTGTPPTERHAVRNAQLRRLESEVARLKDKVNALRGRRRASTDPHGRRLKGTDARIIRRRTFWREPLFGLDRGRAAGVRRHAGVLNQGAVCGRVISVAGRASCMAWLTHPDMRIAARLLNQRITGVLAGQGHQKGLCILRVVARELDVRPGEEVVTSGMDGSFPAGCLIGRVVSARRTDEMGWELDIRPANAPGAIESLLIVSGPQPAVPWPGETNSRRAAVD